ncbi:MAG: glycosyltransferase family 2 protein [Solirubrobacteraceae bacterium]
MRPLVTAVVVSYADPGAAVAATRSLLAQSHPPCEVLLIDNDPEGAPGRAGLFEPAVQVLCPGANIGYTGAANLAAQRARGDWLFFLNPDAIAAPDCLERLLEAVDAPEVAIVGAQVLLPDGRVNAGANPVNIAGVSWSGGYGSPREHGPARDVAAVSGAALMVRRERFDEVGGLCPHFFLYVDDTDLAWRVRLGGGRVRYCPQAVVVHDYEFDKGSAKWFYLERNRAWALLCNLRVSTLVLLAPLLAATEAAVLVRAAREGWLREKLRAWAYLPTHARALLAWRGRVQAGRRVSDGQVLALFAGGVQTGLLEDPPPAWVNAALELYRRCLLRVLRAPQQ